MRFQLIPTALLVSIASVLSAVAGSEVEFAELRPFRTYVQVELESLTADQIEVWYQSNNGWKAFHVAVQPNETLTELPASRRLPRHVATAGSPKPPANPTAVPAALAPITKRIEELLPQTFPNAPIKSVKFNYLGRFARASAFEFVPRSVSRRIDGKYRVGLVSERHFFVNTANGKVKDFGGGQDGFGVIQPKARGLGPVSWVDFALPRSLEGNLVLRIASHRSGEVPECMESALRTQEDVLLKAIAKRVKEMEAGTGPSSDEVLKKVLSKQESTLLPRDVRQTLSVTVNGYARGSGSIDQKRMEFEFEFALAQGPATRKITDAETGVAVEATLDLDAKTLKIVATQGSNQLERTLGLELDSFELYSEIGRTMFEGNIRLDMDDMVELELPGAGGYTSFDLYLYGAIESGRFLKPASCVL